MVNVIRLSQIDQVPSGTLYCYLVLNVITLSWFHSDHIKWLPLYLEILRWTMMIKILKNILVTLNTNSFPFAFLQFRWNANFQLVNYQKVSLWNTCSLHHNSQWGSRCGFLQLLFPLQSPKLESRMHPWRYCKIV